MSFHFISLDYGFLAQLYTQTHKNTGQLPYSLLRKLFAVWTANAHISNIANFTNDSDTVP